jgi:hypothetical protein
VDAAGVDQSVESASADDYYLERLILGRG